MRGSHRETVKGLLRMVWSWRRIRLGIRCMLFEVVWRTEGLRVGFCGVFWLGSLQRRELYLGWHGAERSDKGVI